MLPVTLSKRCLHHQLWPHRQLRATCLAMALPEAADRAWRCPALS